MRRASSRPPTLVAEVLYRLIATGRPGDAVTVDGPVPVSFDPAVLLG